MPYKNKEDRAAFERSDARRAAKRLQYRNRISTPEGRARERAYRKVADGKRPNAWRRMTPEQKRAKNLRSNFGITVAQYDALFEQQAGCCALCGSPPGHKRLAVDHNHTTGKVRSLLCSSCNTGLGLFKDNPERLENAAAYVRQHGTE